MVSSRVERIYVRLFFFVITERKVSSSDGGMKNFFSLLLRVSSSDG